MGKYAEVNLPSEREESYFIERCWGNSVCGKKKKKKNKVEFTLLPHMKKKQKKKTKKQRNSRGWRDGSEESSCCSCRGPRLSLGTMTAYSSL